MTGQLGLGDDAAATRDHAELDLENQVHFEERLLQLHRLFCSAKHEQSTLASVNRAEQMPLRLRRTDESFVVQQGIRSADAAAAAKGANDKYQDTAAEEVSFDQVPSPLYHEGK